MEWRCVGRSEVGRLVPRNISARVAPSASDAKALMSEVYTTPTLHRDFSLDNTPFHQPTTTHHPNLILAMADSSASVTGSAPAESPAQQQARLRRERRAAKIQAGGADRLKAISSLQGGTHRDVEKDVPGRLHNVAPVYRLFVLTSHSST